MEKDSKNKKFKIEDYHDDSQLSVKMMNFGLWIAENRRRIFKIFISLLIFSIIGFFVYSTYGFLYYFLVGRNQDRSLTENFSEIGLDIQAIHSRTQVAPIEFSNLLSFYHGDKLDLAVNLKNKNEKYYSSIDYCFMAGNQEVSCGNTFILPNTEKYILALAQNKQEGQYQFVIKKTAWQKINSREYPDWPNFYASSNNFLINDLNFSPVGQGISTLSFNITNRSPYSFWEVPLNIILKRGETVVGVNHFVLSNFKSLENRAVNISWPAGDSSGIQAQVVSDLDVFNKSVFRRY